jgi:predicted O-linked N-acetylglucosamine transferase (SPINDLY family)
MKAREPDGGAAPRQAEESPVDRVRRHLRNGEFAEAEATAERLVLQAPKSAEAHILLATARWNRGRMHEAASTFRDAVAAEPGNGRAHYLLGCALRDAGRPAEAEAALKDAIAIDPQLADAHLDLGNLFLDRRQYADAEIAYRRAIAVRPIYATAHYNLGNVLRDTERYEAAVAAYREALKHRADYADAYNNLGLALRSLGHLDEAERSLRKSLSIQNRALAHYNLGLVLGDRARFAEAAAAYGEAAALDPDYLAPRMELAQLLGRQRHFAQAEEIYRRLLAKDTCNREAQLACLTNLAFLLREQGKPAESQEWYQKALSIDPHHAEAMAGLCVVKSFLCDWRDRDTELARLLQITNRQLGAGVRTSLAPFDALARPLSPAQHLAIARSWAHDTKRRTAPWRRRLGLHEARGRRHERLRIGYVSQDFRNHALGHLTRSMFGLHDRSAFEIYGYAVCADDGSVYRRVIEQSCEHFADLHGRSAMDVATRIFADEIDIMIDLMGYTANNRMDIVALRPAPVVVGFLQVPGTSGADFIDYMLTDRVVTTPEDQLYYTERLVFLPNCYQPNDNTQRIGTAPLTRADFGLPEDAFVFCCFNNNYKIEPFIFDVWMRILRRVPNGVLWLLRSQPQAEANLRREAEARGIAAERLVFADKVVKPRHLARHRLADLFLDTRYYTAHTTASDALWGGLPVLTCPGDTFASRVSASILPAAGLPELVVPDFEEYERRAIHFASRPDELRAIRDKWAAQRTNCALFDTARYVRNLERAYRMIWDDYLAGIPPRQLLVTEA